MSIHRIKSIGRLRVILVCSGLALILVSAVIPVNFSHAQKRYKPEVVLPSGYPNGFDGYGRIETLEENGVVIQDVFIKLASFVTFHTPTNMDSMSAEFNIGDLVGYITNIEGEITSLWLIQ